ncbi:UNVERIFIED_CONTAM: hypothetical protein NCL1_29365 [Trichonephila clavipes]
MLGPEYETEYSTTLHEDGLETSSLSLRFVAKDKHFVHQNMRLRCTASISRIYTMSNEEMFVGGRQQSSPLQITENGSKEKPLKSAATPKKKSPKQSMVYLSSGDEKNSLGRNRGNRENARKFQSHSAMIPQSHLMMSQQVYYRQEDLCLWGSYGAVFFLSEHLTICSTKCSNGYYSPRKEIDDFSANEEFKRRKRVLFLPLAPRTFRSDAALENHLSGRIPWDAKEDMTPIHLPTLFI